MKKPRLYKKNHLIAIYDDTDTLVGVCDNAKEFAKMYDKSRAVAESILSRISLGRRKAFNFNGKRYTVHLIALTENDIKGLFDNEK